METDMITTSGHKFPIDATIEERAEQEQLAYALAMANHIKILQLNQSNGMPLHDDGAIHVKLHATTTNENIDGDAHVMITVIDNPVEDEFTFGVPSPTHYGTSVSGAHDKAIRDATTYGSLTGTVTSATSSTSGYGGSAISDMFDSDINEALNKAMAKSHSTIKV